MNLKKLFFGGAADAPASRKKKGLIALGTVLALLIAFACGNAYGKYVQGQQKTGTISGKAFYFESDFLDVADASKTYTVYPGGGGTASVTFHLQNHIDELRVSEMAINYTVTVKEGANDVSDATAGGAKTGTLQGTALEPKDKASVTLSGLEPGKTYLVTVTGNGGYVKTIQAKFVVAELDKKVYKHLQIQGEEVLLTVWTENVKGAAQITITDEDARNKLVPDNTDPALSGVTKGQSVIIDQANSFGITYSSHLYRFFNPEDVDDLNVEKFTVTITPDGEEPVPAMIGTP